MELFEATTINGMRLENRFVRSATILGMAGEDGSSTPRLNEAMKALASGGAGLVITGFAYVLRGGRTITRQLGCCDDMLTPGLAEMASAVHEVGGKIALQMVHCGIFSNTEITGEDAIGPSPLQSEDGAIGREMTKGEISELVEAYRAATRRAIKAGFDAVQVHAAHGYLIGQFLSPYFNKRTDDYGGSLESRSRLLIHVIEGVREEAGADYPVMVKINSEDLLEGGFTVDEMLQVAAKMENASIDAVELSGGTSFAYHIKHPELSPFRLEAKGAYWRSAAKRFKESIDVPLILVGGIRSIEEAEDIVGQGIADYISMCRPLIREPGLINRWKSGDRRPSECISDNACFGPGHAGEGVRCIHTS
jgi:2,4-dienoyl-CoA reductase-like NADH-dependent reductase (Old Yellow Enzyme family)